ncbi:glycosyltransferase [Thermoflexibacter ruber]|uniref:Glycosyltransferase, catalytic subunit of cellulose synthase and poly-beta-1,6-N-acetylglucosamine synthase n=1 Tax=Thermoflexibacter ruber TaxID=1003 RepID=A0A1I2IUH6_9BACT|nr:glycosyltransferase [Thermoflexibacter ruber]SFF44677.1 Glycosyltransferase, catalytic subunit of cellulose synthase and poly-beta-1,6-N-acetylglucosamine synthase [Thermoflexibacter ruber]
MLVSILLAVRNEEKNIKSCLDALSMQDFPLGVWEVWIGNDRSEDCSKEIILDFIKDKPHFKLIDIQDNLGQARYKGNVIAHLAHYAQGDYFLITDADMYVPPTWIRGMVKGFQQGKKIGVVTGFSLVRGKSLIAKLDGVDWVQNVGLMNIASMLKIPTNAMGNNMAVSKKAYWEMGGIENQPYMVCEDLIMFKGILAKGWDFVHLHSKEIVGISQPQANFCQLLQQRQRWLDGALRLPWYLLIPLLTNGLFLFVLLSLLFVVDWKISVGVWLLRFLLHSLTITFFAQKIHQTWVVKYLLSYEIFITFFNPLVFAYYLFPAAMEWKGKKE